MAYTVSILNKMITKSSIIFLLLHPLIIQVIQGHLGCPNNLIPCLNQTDCIDIEQVCMGDHHCVDQRGQTICNHCSSDEEGAIACLTRLTPQLMFECLSPNQKCDNRKDCLNNKDESSCEKEKCAHDSWTCHSGACIKSDLLCNTRPDCADGSDEGDICHNHVCGPNKFRCRTGECIPESEKCDGVSHCPDEDDEENCSHSTSNTVKDSCSIPANTFTCSSSIYLTCISNDRVCDGYQDCPMNDDEQNCNEICTSESKCKSYSNVKCIQHPTVNQLCRCNQQGYRLTDNPTQICQDFDECNDSLNGYCSFECTNNDGSFNCTCPSGFTIDPETKTCRKVNDSSKANFLILSDDNISFYNIFNTTNQHPPKLLQRISFGKYDHIQYDSIQMFLIYYDPIKHAMFCKSSFTDKTLLLISNINIHTFAYNANERTLYLVENQSRTLRMYTPITCEISQDIQMHSWRLKTHVNAIQSMEIDFDNRQFLFATWNEFLISNMSEPNSTQVMYSSDREIKRFIYDQTFKRIFWTTMNKTQNGLFSVHTCENGFKKCLDTAIVLPVAWPFAFFNDGLLYLSLAPKPIDFVEIYGKNRFSNQVLIPTEERIRSFLFLNNPSTHSSNLCTGNSSITPCKNQLCLQINSKEIKCLSIDEKLISSVVTTSNNIDLNLANNAQSLVNDDINSQISSQRNKFRRRTSNVMLFSIITLSAFVVILAVFVKRCHTRLNRKALWNEQRQNERCLAADEPNLDEFNVMVDDRVSKERADYARDVLQESPRLLLVGRRRDSV